MGDEYMHNVYRSAHRETTQWDDAQRKLGNLPPLPPEHKPEKFAPEADLTTADKVVGARTEKELEDLEDDVDDNRELAELRRQRLQELRAGPRKPRFGSFNQIGRSDFVREVTEASGEVFVVVHLFKDHVADCEIMSRCLAELADKYSSSKFVRIISTDAIPNYPDSNLPTVIVYKDKDVARTFIGMKTFGGHRATPENVALVLNTAGCVCVGDDGDNDEMETRLNLDLIRRVLEKVVDGEGGASGDESSDFGD